MRPLALCVILFCAPALLAQDKQPAPEQPAQTQEQTQTRATPAPQLGHPLDPADVDVLTGKTKAQTNTGYRMDPLSYAYGNGYAGYPEGEGSWGTRRYASFGPARTPFLFERTGRGSSFFFGSPGFFGPKLFFFGAGRGSFFFVF